MPALMASTLGVVLAGGRSSRMGTDKANILVAGKSLLEHAIDLFVDTNIGCVCVSGREHGSEWLLDILSNKGPLGAIYSVVKTKKYQNFNSILFIPVDMPLLTSDIIKKLAINLNTHQAVCYNDHPLPLLLKNDAILLKHLDSILKKNSLNGKNKPSIKHLLSLVETKHLDINKDILKDFANLNTINDLKQI